MSFRYLTNDLLDEINAFEQKIGNKQQPEIVARCLFEIWRRYRASAISVLLADADRDAFFERLKLSGLARKRLLAGPSVAAENGRFACAGLLEPFFDSLASGEEELARDIAVHSPTAWNPIHEFEDDFHYAKFLFELLKRDYKPSPAGTTHLKKFTSALEGNDSARLNVCHSFHNHDQALFNEAFGQLIEQWHKFYKDKYKRSSWKNWVFLTERKIFMEGLALLYLAVRAGFETRYEYPGIPVVARISH